MAEIKIDSKATEYLKDKIGGGGGGTSIEVEDITALTSEQCESLKAGDCVIQVVDNGDENFIRTLFVVQEKSKNGMSLITFDGNGEVIFYRYTKNRWRFQGQDEYYVEPNPELEGDEEELSSIDINGEKFKMPSGGGSETHLYEQYINVKSAPSSCEYVNFNIKILTATPYTIDTFSSLKEYCDTFLTYTENSNLGIRTSSSQGSEGTLYGFIEGSEGENNGEDCMAVMFDGDCSTSYFYLSSAFMEDDEEVEWDCIVHQIY